MRAALRRLRIALLPVPGQAVGLAVLVAVLAAAVVSAPLMVASAEQAAWEQQERRLPPSALGTTVLSSTFSGDGRSPTDRIARIDDLDDAVRAAAVESGLSEPALFLRLRVPAGTGTPDGVESTTVVHLAGAPEHLQVVAGEPSEEGVLVPEELAASADVRPGGAITLTSADGNPVRLPVSGLYRTPAEPMPAFWEARDQLFLARYDPEALESVPPPPVVFAPRELAVSAYAALREDVYLEWFSALGSSVPVAEARRSAEGVAELQLRLTDPGAAAAGLVTAQNFADLLPRSALPGILADVDRTVDLLSPPVRAVGVGGGVAALVLVGAWAAQRVRRRDDELRSLAARGLSPGRGAVHAVRESALPGVGGVAVGSAGAWLIVRSLGPSPVSPATVLAPTGWSLLISGTAIVAVIAVVTAVLVARLDQGGRVHGGAVLRRVPWLGLVAVAAVLTAVPLTTGAAGEDAGRIGVLPLLLPLLVTVVATGTVTAGLPWLGRALGDRLRRLPPGAYLAARRVLSAHGPARLVVVTTALSLGLVTYAGALTESTARTIAAKASVATGSDVVVPIARTSPRGGSLPDDAMLVGTETTPVVVPGEIRADLLLVRPEQVPAVVRWDDSFAELPLEQLMAALGSYRGDRVPVVLAGPLPDTGLDATGGAFVLDFTYYSIPVEVVARAEAFPGQTSREPLLIGDWDRYTAALGTVSRVPELVVAREVWARGEVGDVVAEVSGAGLVPSDVADVASADEFAARPELDAQTWALGYLRAMALAAGVLALVGVALHAMAQQRRRTVAALLLSRMGMSRRSSDGAIAIEIGLLTGLAAGVAVAVALPASALVLLALDPVPDLRPDPLFAVPWVDLAAVLTGVALVTAGGSALVGRAARRNTGGQVLRDAS